MKGVQPYLVPFIKRFLLILVISTLVMLGISELGYRLLRDDTSRDPETIELIIPEGTADLIARGEPNPTIPEEMIFVVGDILVVKNEDLVDHELGPLWIPAGKSASLKLDQANDYAYSCSFQPSYYFDLTVRAATTWRERLGALWYGVPPTVMFLLVYSFIIRPLHPAGSAKLATPENHD
jgi:hypothetical protein